MAVKKWLRIRTYVLKERTFTMFEINQTQPVAIYVRVSTDDQQERKTIESQIEFAEKYCELHEISIYKIYKDDGIQARCHYMNVLLAQNLYVTLKINVLIHCLSISLIVLEEQRE